MSGQTSYHAGLAAEDSVARNYERQGMQVLARRWRGQAGEIDLIVGDSARILFVEVKKSRSFERAAERLNQHQIQRIFATASEFLETQPNGQLTDCQFDVALVDSTGDVRILANALGP